MDDIPVAECLGYPRFLFSRVQMFQKCLVVLKHSTTIYQISDSVWVLGFSFAWVWWTGV
jgi:hypothetical protein